MSITKTRDKTELVLRSQLWLRRLLKLEHTTCQFVDKATIMYIYRAIFILRIRRLEAKVSKWKQNFAGCRTALGYRASLQSCRDMIRLLRETAP